MKTNNSMQSRTRIAASLGFLALALMAACGDNGFQPPGSGGDQPEISAFALAPDTLPEGDTLTIALSAAGPRNLTQVRLQFRGALIKDTTIAVPDPAREIDALIQVRLPNGTGPDSLLYLDAVIVDAAGIESDLTEAPDTVFVVDATQPAVTAGVSPQDVGSGDPLDITVTAADNRGLVSIGYVVIDGASGDTAVYYTEPLAGAPLSFQNTYTIPAPTLNPTNLVVRTFAVDRNALMGQSGIQNVGLEDRIGPLITLIETTPDSTIPLGVDIQVHIQADDPSGIRQLVFVGLAPEGDTLLGTDTVITRYGQVTIGFPRPGETEMPVSVIRAPILSPVDDGSGPLSLVILAEDGFGNVSEITKEMYVGGPDVSLVYPTEDVAFGVGQSFNVEVSIADPSGIDSAKVFLTGDSSRVLDLPLPANTTVPFTTTQTLTLPSTPETITLMARAWNPEEVGGQTQQVIVDVLAAPPADVDEPVVSLTAELLTPPESQPRMEMKDLLRITVTARDKGSSGLAEIGFKAVASRAGAQHVISETSTYSASLNLERHIFEVPLDSLYALFGITGAAVLDSIVPDEIDLRIHGFAADEVGQLACSVGLNEQRPCTPGTYTAGGTYEASDTTGLLLEMTAVRGHTVLLDNASAVIADLAIDTIDDRLFLSNISENLVEMLDLDEDPDVISFLDPVLVGSQPWGIFIGERVVSATDAAFLGGLVAAGDTARTLIVGNSGGTNMSLVHLDASAANVEEVDHVRLLTPNAVLHELEERLNDVGGATYVQRVPYDFSDRPQFLAQDSLLRIVYSTVPTTAANTSTVRYIAVDPDPTSTTDVPEVRFLLHTGMVNPQSESKLALANIDSIQIRPITDQSDEVRIFTHEPGYPNNLIFNATWATDVVDAVDDVIAQIDAVMSARGQAAEAPMFYPFFMRGEWVIDAVGLSDTTFVSAAGNRGKIAIGEGAASPTGRIILWHADQLAALSTDIQILDLINNASERVLGVGLNWNGSLGVARGAEATYFFTPDLRLQGLYQQPGSGGAGATFHPDHDDLFDGGHTDNTRAGVAFTGTPDRSVEVVNTFHFNKINELQIRDNVVGPLRAGPPLASDNAGLGRSCVGEDCVVAKLYGITDAGGVVIINVRFKDLANP